MGKIAFVFSGQGDQFPGMGKSLVEQYPVAREIFSLCDTIRPGTSLQCFEGTEDELKETRNTQPCLFAMELAAAAVLADAGIHPDTVAGFSLGEVVACTAAGYMDKATGFRVVCKRGELMQEAAEQIDTSMAAIVKLPSEQVKKLCTKYSDVFPVNFNCPGQVTVAGLNDQMPAFCEDVKAAGGRALPLKVKGGFHSPFMKKAASDFRNVLESVSFSKSNIILYSNMTALPYTADVGELLAKQICNPVYFEVMISNMISDGVDTFVEIGPGKTLYNMIGKIDSSVKRYSVTDIPQILSEVSVC